MNPKWNEIYNKALIEHKNAEKEAAFMMSGMLTHQQVSSMAIFYPSEVKNLFKTRKLVNYIEKRMNREST
jgi:hypothetical protein